MVELALVGPMFFGMLFATVDAGLYLYARSAVTNGDNNMTYALAAKGRDADADTFAIAELATEGLTRSALVTVTEVDIFRGKASAAGVLTPDSSCGGLCQNTYNAQGYAITGPQTWPPVNRDVSSGYSDFAGVTITYTYRPIFFRTPAVITVHATRYVRLEPQT